MISRFAKTRAEAEAFQRNLARARCVGQAVEMEFLSTRAFVEEILPPCLATIGEPRARIIIGGYHNPEVSFFCTCQISFACRYQSETTTVWYTLTGVTDNWVMLHLQREAWGENLKHGTAQIFAGPNAVDVLVKRAQGLVLRGRIDFEKPLADEEGCFRSVSIRGAIDKNGHGFEYGVDAVVTNTVFRKTQRETGAAKVELFDTFLDTWAQIPISQLGRAEVYAVETEFSAEKTEGLAAPDEYLPYVLGAKYDDISRFTSFPDPRSSGRGAAT